MPLQIQLEDDDVRYLNSDAKDALVESGLRYSRDVISEALRLESTAGSSSGNPQVTSGIIEDADLVLRKGYKKPRRSRWLKIAQVVSIVSTFIAGVLADYSFLQEPIYLVILILAIAVSLFCSILLLLAE